MAGDIIAEQGALMLGSRLKRLGERLQADTARFIEQSGLGVQPSQYPILYLLDRNGPMTVSELVEATAVSQPGVTRNLSNLIAAGTVETDKRHRDQRHKTVALTPQGSELVERSKREIWPFVRAAASEICRDLEGPLLAQVSDLESRLAAAPLDQRARNRRGEGLRILPFSDELAGAFRDINAEWIEAMFKVEDGDRIVLDNPREQLVTPGGDILFVEAEGLGIVGTCALRKTGEAEYELTKMGVLESARGRKAGEFLLHAIIDRAMQLDAKKLFLLTNKKNLAAIHLYEKLGFVHDEGVMRDHGALYERCDVAMLYRGGGQ